MGKVSASQITFDTVTINSTIGDISLDTVKEANITSDLGKVTIKKIDATKDSNITTKAGDVTIKSVNNLDIDADTNTGKKNIKKTKDNDYLLTIKTDTGDIEVK